MTAIGKVGRYRAVLFDVGGVIDTEARYDRAMTAALLDVLGERGLAPSPAMVKAAARWAVACHAPDVYQAILWRLSGGDVELAQALWAEMRARLDPDAPLELRSGIAELLARLKDRDLALAVVADNPTRIARLLDGAGIGYLFDGIAVESGEGLCRPDPWPFLNACAALGIEPAACLFVGDRIDNDVTPARRLGMTVIRFRTGRHRNQRPRTWQELPHAEVDTVESLSEAIDGFVARSVSRG